MERFLITVAALTIAGLALGGCDEPCPGERECVLNIAVLVVDAESGGPVAEVSLMSLNAFTCTEEAEASRRSRGI